MSEHRFRQTLWDAATLAASGSLESSVISCQQNDIEYLALKAVAGGVANVRIQFKISNDGGSTFNEYADQDDIQASTIAAHPTTPDDMHHYLVPAHPHLKIKVTELAAVQTTLTGILDCSEII